MCEHVSIDDMLQILEKYPHVAYCTYFAYQATRIIQSLWLISWTFCAFCIPHHRPLDG